MNIKIPALICAGVLAGTGAAAYTVRTFKAAPAAHLHIPATPDSTQKENPFRIEKLLDSRGPLFLPGMTSDWTTVETDSTGHVSLLSEKNPTLHSYATGLRASRFAKGKLILNTRDRAEISGNGESLAKKTDSDSLPSDLTAQITLEPEADLDIRINLISDSGDGAPHGFTLEFVPDEEYKDVEITGGAELGHRFTPRHTMIGERITGVSLSPDGKYLFTRYSETFSASETFTHAVLTETATGRIISADIPDDANWMPYGCSLYYSRKKPAGYDVYAIDVPSMNSRILASAIPESSFTMSRDGKYLFYYTQCEGAKDEGVMRRVKSPDDRIPGDRDRYYITRYDLASRIAVPLTFGGASTTICDFTRDGSKMLYLSTVQKPSEYPFYFNSLVEMDMETLDTDTIVARDGFINGGVYSPDGKRIFVTGGPQAFGRIGMNAPGHDIPNDFDIQGFLLDIASRGVKAVTRGFDPSISGTPVWNVVDGRIYFRAVEGFNTNVYSFDPSKGTFTRLDTSVPSVSGFSLGDSEADRMAYWGGDFTDTGMGYVLNLKNGRNSLIADPMKATLADVDFGKMEPWQFTASDGTLIDGYMCLPPDFDPDRKYPLIVYYYGGTTPSSAAMHHLYGPQVFASRDYVVYVVNPSGTIGYGQEFSARHVNAWGKRTAEDIIEGVKLFCDEHPFVDRKKVGCLGASYGGFMTQYLQTLTDIFAAAVSHAGISNVTSYWGEGFWGYSYNSVAAAKSYPWSDPELYTRQGSLFNADKIHTPLLLLHGKLDTNVPIGESIQIFNALRVLGRDVELITVEDENHVISNFDRKLVWQNTIMAWFAKWLQDDPRWWNSLYGE